MCVQLSVWKGYGWGEGGGGKWVHGWMYTCDPLVKVEKFSNQFIKICIAKMCLLGATINPSLYTMVSFFPLRQVLNIDATITQADARIDSESIPMFLLHWPWAIFFLTFHCVIL